jgi:hypothetical protein
MPQTITTAKGPTTIGPAKTTGIGRVALLAALVLAFTLVLGVSVALAAPPSVSIDAPGTVSYTTAQVSGSVNPEGNENYYGSFEYSTDQVNWNVADYLGPLPSGSGPQHLTAELTGLKAATHYWVRLAALNFIDPAVLSATPEPSFTTLALAEPTVSIDSVSAFTGTTAHFSGTIDPEAPAGNPAASEVSWHFECTPECPGLEGTIPPDSSSHQVSANATGLKPHTEYQVNLIATNAAGPVTAGPEHFTTNAIAPTAQTIPAFALAGGTKAILAGRVNPENSHTSYWIEYGIDQGYGTSIPAAHDADPGLGEESNFVTQEITGLQPSSTYHFRIRASNPAGAATGQDQIFTTSSGEGLGSSIGSLTLPDDRTWEQVSPADKHDFDIYRAGAVASASGNALAFKSQGSFADQPTSRAALLSDYVARREGTSWLTHGITPQGTEFYSSGGYLGFSDELDKAFVTFSEPVGRSLDPEVEAGEHPTDPGLNFRLASYLRDNETGKYKAFGKGATITGFSASADYSHLVLQTEQGLPDEAPCEAAEPAPPGQEPTCIYEFSNGALHRASVSPAGSPSYGQLPGTHNIFNEFVSITSGGQLAHGISNDGGSLYFTNAGLIYRRVNGSVTTEIGQSERTAPPVTPGGSTTIINAEAAHGQRALLQSTAELVNGDDNASSDLYIDDVGKPAGERLTLISKGNLPGTDAEVQSVYLTSEDLHRVYFLANNQILAGEPNDPGPKLYLWEDNGGRANLNYVATLSSEDGNSAHISPDGRYLAFLSKARQTGYDNAGQSEIYLYDAVAGTLVCASCDPEGRPAANSPLFSNHSEVVDAEHELRNVSDAGIVFFQTPEGLVPRDSNGQTDVYEYENGGPHLISSGVGGTESVFLDASVSGDDAFFATTDSLVKWDVDQNFDAYDARVNGGLPEPPPEAIGCEGDSCQAPPAALDEQTPASASFSGSGNARPTVSKAAVETKAKPLTRAQKLSKALKACEKVKAKKRRSACEKKAKKLYGRSK